VSYMPPVYRGARTSIRSIRRAAAADAVRVIHESGDDSQHRRLGPGRLRPIAATPVWLCDVRADADCGEVEHGLIAVIALVDDARRAPATQSRRLGASSICSAAAIGVSPASAPCSVTATMASVSRSTGCSALCARCVGPSFIFTTFASGSPGCVQSVFEVFFFRFRSGRATKSSRVACRYYRVRFERGRIDRDRLALEQSQPPAPPGLAFRVNTARCRGRSSAASGNTAASETIVCIEQHLSAYPISIVLSTSRDGGVLRFRFGVVFSGLSRRPSNEIRASSSIAVS
jgi:hypothetical protein